tara:strand:- start:1519 stop:1917 length:399 start_codon:yes stop_codon:yes gene_type:complete
MASRLVLVPKNVNAASLGNINNQDIDVRIVTRVGIQNLVLLQHVQCAKMAHSKIKRGNPPVYIASRECMCPKNGTEGQRNAKRAPRVDISRILPCSFSKEARPPTGALRVRLVVTIQSAAPTAANWSQRADT